VSRVRGSIRLKHVRLGRIDPAHSLSEIEVTFANVTGALQAAGEPTGFMLLDEAGNDTHGIYKTRLCGNVVRLEHPFGDATRHQVFSLAYGAALDTYCNIVDAAGMTLPAFGPVAINTERFPRRTPREERNTLILQAD
jgi:hypothetical protein